MTDLERLLAEMETDLKVLGDCCLFVERVKALVAIVRRFRSAVDARRYPFENDLWCEIDVNAIAAEAMTKDAMLAEREKAKGGDD